MTGNKKEPDKKAGSAAPQTPARPHATLDLKATEVTPAKDAAKPEAAKQETPKTMADKPSSETRQPEKAADSSAAKPAVAGDAKATAAASASGSKPAAATTAASTDKSSKPGASVPPAGTPPPRPNPRGYGGFFTHLAAGIAGGVVALLAADILAGQLGLTTANENPEQIATIQTRLAAIEGRGQNPNSELAARLAAAEAKLGNVEQLDENINGVSKRQGEFSRQLTEVQEQLKSEGGAGPDVQPRIAKLEEQLQMMSAAAAKDPQSGQLPQLAAITGKLADLESTVSNQLNALRQNLNQEIDTRLTAATEAGQAARSGTQRMDRELSTLKAETAEMANGINNVKGDTDRLSAAVKTTQEDMRRLKTDVDERLATFAKPEQITAAVEPVASKIAAMQNDVQSVLKSEGDRRTTASRIVLSLELANLKRAIDRGQPYAAELAQARKVAGDSVDLAPLDRFALEGVSTTTQLRNEFRPVANAIIDAQEGPTDASIVDRLLAGAKSVVRVRRTDHSPEDKSVEAIVGRMEKALNEDRLNDVLSEAKGLPPPAQEAAREFLAKVEARASVDSALATVESQLKASLAAAPANGTGSSAQ
jgi:hypothetical protein